MFTHPGAVSLTFNSTQRTSAFWYLNFCFTMFVQVSCLLFSWSNLCDKVGRHLVWSRSVRVTLGPAAVCCQPWTPGALLEISRFVAERSHTAQVGLDSVQFSWWVTENIGEKENSATPLQQLGNKLPIPLVSLLCQKNSQRIRCVIFKDAEHSCCLLFPMENRAVSLLIDWLLARNYKWEWVRDFHRLTWCRNILNLLKTSFSVKINIFVFIRVLFVLQHCRGGKSKVHPICFVLLAMLCSPHTEPSQIAVLPQIQNQLPAPVRHCCVLGGGQRPPELIREVNWAKRKPFCSCYINGRGSKMMWLALDRAGWRWQSCTVTWTTGTWHFNSATEPSLFSPEAIITQTGWLNSSYQDLFCY